MADQPPTRFPKPWLWQARKQWVVSVGTKRVYLAPAHAPMAEVSAAYRRFLVGSMPATQGGEFAAGPDPRGDLDVNDIICMFLDERIPHLSLDTGKLYRETFDRLRAVHGGLRAAQFSADHLHSLLSAHPNWGQATRRINMATIKLLFAWAARRQLIADDPLAGVKPPPMPARAHVLNPEQIGRLLAALAAEPEPSFRDLALVLLETGARPKEIRTLESGWIDWEHGIARLNKHKTSKTTGRPRVIHLNAAALQICRRWADQYPTGPLFRNSKGRPWQPNSLVCRFAKLRDRLGLPKGSGLYTFRHHFVTDAIVAGLPLPTIARLAGHSNTSTIQAHYDRLHERPDYLREQLERFRPGGGEPGAEEKKEGA